MVAKDHKKKKPLLPAAAAARRRPRRILPCGGGPAVFRAAAFLLFAAFLAAAFLGPVGCSGGKGKGNGKNLIVLLVDTLRADHLGCYGYGRPTSPNLDRFAKDAVSFMKNYAQASRTGPSVASIFTGLHVTSHGVVNPLDQWDGKGVLVDKRTTLAEILSAAGYDCRAVVSNPNVYATYGFAQGFAEYKQAPIFAGAGAINRIAAEWIDGMGKDRPFFLYLHYMEPHSPYAAPRALRGLFVDPAYRGPITGEHAQLDAILRGDLNPTAADKRRLEDFYDQEIVSWDREFGRLIRYIEGKGILGNTVVVVVADHGEEFFEHGGVLHGYTLYDEVLHVPLLIRTPGIPARQVDKVTRNIDLLPTVLDLLGLPPWDEAQGESLAGMMRGGKGKNAFVFSEARIRAVKTVKSRALRTAGGWKLIETLVPEEAPPELYDLKSDPGERKNLFAARPDTARAVQEQMRILLKDLPKAKSRSVTLDKEAIEQLRQMGYIGGRDK